MAYPGKALWRIVVGPVARRGSILNTAMAERNAATWSPAAGTVSFPTCCYAEQAQSAEAGLVCSERQCGDVRGGWSGASGKPSPCGPNHGISELRLDWPGG
jgi:hypothetical protein